MSKILLKFSTAILISTAVSSCVTTNAEGVKQVTGQRTAVSAERTRLDRASTVKLDCSARVLPEMQIVQAPAHGAIDIVHENVDGKFRGEYSKCTGKNIPGTVAYYTSQKGFVGHDKVTIRNSYKDGVVRDHVFEINVVK